MATFVAIAIPVVAAMAAQGLGLRAGAIAFGVLVMLAIILHYAAP
jgi:hypothetical protein